ncbi:helix-turn-helix domain-containing protein [uncultured Methylobacterium sp.]|uniref:helix-turn-helix domain-containing protein n=1 Tax=uncultured Methylobacterium sp. TaxID=157278 RepID=UPI0035CBC2D7
MKPVSSERTGARTISIEEAATWLGISRNGAYEAAKRGEIPTIKIGRLLKVPVAPFERLLDQPTLSPEGGV